LGKVGKFPKTPKPGLNPGTADLGPRVRGFNGSASKPGGKLLPSRCPGSAVPKESFVWESLGFTRLQQSRGFEANPGEIPFFPFS